MHERRHKEPSAFYGLRSPEAQRVCTECPEVDTDDTRCTRGNQGFNLCRVDVVRVTFHIAENRSDRLPLESVSRCDKSERGHDDFARKVQRSYYELQRNCGIGDANHVSNLKVFF